MKIPVGFGTKLFFRVVFPGLILTALLSRFTYAALLALGVNGYLGYVASAQVVIFGCVFVALDMPLYMAFEGRRYWPSLLFEWGRKAELWRLRSIHQRMTANNAFGRKKLPKGQRANAVRNHLEAAVEVSHYPLKTSTLTPTAIWPTRIGNLIAAYEQYPGLKYGLDAVFFWPRIWLSIDNALREEIDNQQALVDGLLYSTVALGLGLPICVAYALVDTHFPGLLRFNVGQWWDVLAGVCLLLAAVLTHRLSLFLHASFGEIFKATFDQHRGKLDLEDVTDTVAKLLGDQRLERRSEYMRNMAIWRFLRWHRIRPKGATRNQKARLE